MRHGVDWYVESRAPGLELCSGVPSKASQSVGLDKGRFFEIPRGCSRMRPPFASLLEEAENESCQCSCPYSYIEESGRRKL
jgi:hypothetical protein